MSNRLIWEIRALRFTDEYDSVTLSASGIFEISNSLATSSGITSSSIVVFGDTINNDSNVCCLTLVEAMNEKSCTILFRERITYEYVYKDSENGYVN